MTSPKLSNDAVAFVCALVRERSAIELEPCKSYLIEARLALVAKNNGFASPADFLDRVRAKRHPDLEARVVEALTTNETSFFRDVHPFEALRRHVLPNLRQLRATQRTLNIWSAGCSTGQELYSIAMLLREYFLDLAGWKVDLWGTDLSDEVLTRAREGRYSQVEVNRGLPSEMLSKYFRREGVHWRVAAQIREAARFSKLNLIEAWRSMPTMDVVFLRNVLIYFSAETKRSILRKVRQVMSPQGVLFLGAAETTLNLDASFQPVQVDHNVHYRLVSSDKS